ncbi:hypothetical protein [Nonomuraea dietziae]|uniref:hypothetical protein n=1 Tax=Nonomuraea dietziae TaxID=65515 RepID=UPI0031DF6BDD
MLVPLLAAGSLLLGAALPGGAPSPAPVRYAGLTSCPGANGKRHICGPWRLWLRGGGDRATEGRPDPFARRQGP